MSLREIKPLNNAIDDSCLIEIKTSGAFYTWNNCSRNSARTFSKIDYSFCNQITLNSYPNVHNHIPLPMLSDHSPQILSFGVPALKVKSSFKFFRTWLHDAEFFTIVKHV